MELPICFDHVELSVATVREVQKVVCTMPKSMPFDSLIGNYPVRRWIDAFCSYMVKECRKRDKTKCDNDGPCDRLKKWLSMVAPDLGVPGHYCQFCGEKRNP